MSLGPFVGPIYTVILIVDCLFFAFLEWWMPRENIDYVDVTWDATRFEKVSHFSLHQFPRGNFDVCTPTGRWTGKCLNCCDHSGPNDLLCALEERTSY